MKIGILGHFGGQNEFFDGQTIKTKSLYDALIKYGEYNCIKIDTYNWKKHPFALVRNIKKAFRECDAIIMLPAHAGVKVFGPLLVHFNKRYSKKIYYSVIGGWLPTLLTKKKKVAKALRKFDGIWVETNKMKESMESINFDNISIIPNFKDLQLSTLSRDVIYNKPNKNYCIFSRVIKEKGITDAINVIAQINFGSEQKTMLDIYGPIGDQYKEEFDTLVNANKDFVKYYGCIAPNSSVDILEKYYGLLFPTKFYTEGIPGTIVDAMFAKIPVIASHWENCYDVMNDDMGIIYDFDDVEELKESLLKMNNLSKDEYMKMCAASANRANAYTPQTCVELIKKCLGE